MGRFLYQCQQGGWLRCPGAGRGCPAIAGGAGKRNDIACARHADIEEAALLCLVLARRVAFAEAGWADLVACRHACRELPLRQPRKIDDRELEPFALMQRQDVDRVLLPGGHRHRHLGRTQRAQVMQETAHSWGNGSSFKNTAGEPLL